MPQTAPWKGRATEASEEDSLPETGHDSFRMKSGIKYEGEWKRFDSGIKRHGHGEFSTPDFTYIGEFEEDQFHGEGEVQFSSGVLYVGAFSHGQINGEGDLTFVDGSRYKGQWRNGQMHGLGTYYTLDEKQWTGNWSNGMSECPIFHNLPPTVESEEDEPESLEEESDPSDPDTPFPSSQSNSSHG
jgi:hypothetical protein